MPRYRIKSNYVKENIKELRKRRKAYEAKMEREARELDARRDQDAHELMVMRHEAVTRYQEGMDTHDVIDPLAGVTY